MAAAPAPVEVTPMRHYRLLGDSGLRVSPLCLGLMAFGEAWKENTGGETDNADDVFDAFAAAGGNFLDVANNYHNGGSETILGNWLGKKSAAERARFVVATKFTSNNGEGVIKNSPNVTGMSRKNMFETVESSLKRLQTSYIDLLYVHWNDHCTPVQEVMRGLNDLVSSGKVHYIGVSDWPAWMVSKANMYAASQGWVQFVVYQGRYSLIDRTLESDVIPMALDAKMAICPWGALGQGKLTGKVNRDDPAEKHSFRGGWCKMTPRDFDIQDAVTKVAQELKVSNSQVCVAWQLAKSRIIPIVGVRTIAQLQDNIAALTVKLSPEQIKTLEEASKYDLPFPQSFTGNSIETCPWLAFGGNEGIKVVPW